MNSSNNNPQGQYEDINFGMDINVIPSGEYPTQFPTHWHRDIEIIMIPENIELSVFPVFTIQDTVYELHPGDILIIWQGELHRNVQTETMSAIGFQFSDTILQEIGDFAPVLSSLANQHLFTGSDYPTQMPYLRRCLSDIALLQQSQNKFYRVQKLMRLLEFFMQLSSCVGSDYEKLSTDINVFENETSLKIKEACRYISANSEKELSLTDVSFHFGFSTSYFSRVFKQVMGISFMSYLLGERVKKAQTYLSDFNLSITEIAYQSGFQSISTFNRVFRQYTGYSPSQYRKLYL